MEHHLTHLGLGYAGRGHDCLREICGNQLCSVVLSGAKLQLAPLGKSLNLRVA